MKNLTLLTLLFSSAMAHAFEAKPLLQFRSTPGYVMAKYAFDQTCSIDREGVTLKLEHVFDGRTFSKKTKIGLSTKFISDLVSGAEKGEITEDPTGIVDAGQKTYSAFVARRFPLGPATTGLRYEEIVLKGKPTIKITNHAPEAARLVTIIDTLCMEPLRKFLDHTVETSKVADVRLEGTFDLVYAIGGDTTGMGIQTENGLVEIDFPKNSLFEFVPGKKVRALGYKETRSGIARPSYEVIVITKIYE